MMAERNRLRELRKARNLTQEQLEDLSGIDQGTISRLENHDLDNPGFFTVQRIAVILGVSTDVLMGDGESKRTAERRRGVVRRQRPERRVGLDRRVQ